jgi:signal transduction histidine kinase
MTGGVWDRSRPGSGGPVFVEAEELERRRIARELHDDIGQGLALLSIEIDLLGREPPATPAEFASRVQGLSIRVRELSSAVHGLSHQLHPSKVEQLGLVAALRGLCQEVGVGHDLEVTFTHFDVPEVVTPATALCLYRVGQEALRNVVRHSGTARAAVELAGTPDGLRLVVSDRGAGFDPAALGVVGLGLVSMRERLQMAGGELTIHARPGGGVRLAARVPAPAYRSAGTDEPTPASTLAGSRAVAE